MSTKKKKSLTFQQAAADFESQPSDNTDLEKILKNLLKYSDGTKILLQELDLVIDDLKL